MRPFRLLADGWTAAVDRLGEVDPGGILISNALKALLAIASSAYLAYQMALAIPSMELPAGLARHAWLAQRFADAKSADGLILTLPTVAVAVSAGVFLFLPMGRWPRELRDALMICALTSGTIIAAGLVGPGDFGYGVLPISIAFVLIVTVSFYTRRWGQFGSTAGVPMMFAAIFMVGMNPGRAEGFWFALPALIGAAVALPMRLLTIRPSLYDAYRERADRFLARVHETLDLVTKAGELHRVVSLAAADTAHRKMHREWVKLQRLGDMIVRLDPRIQPRLAAQGAATYRMVLAVGATADALAAMPDDARAQWVSDRRVKAGLRNLSEWIKALREMGFGSPDHRDSSIEDALNAAAERRDALAVRATFGLRRVELSLRDFSTGRTDAAAGKRPAAAQADKSAAAGNARRLATQAFIATSITTALAVIFSFPHGYWATLTAAWVLNGTVGHTLQRATKRAGGTIVGVSLALLVVSVLGARPLMEGAMVGLAMLAALLVPVARYTIVSAAVGFLVVLVLHLETGASDGQMLERIYMTVLGAAIALGVSLTVYPTLAANNARAWLAQFLETVRDEFARLAAAEDSAMSSSGTALAQRLRDLEDEVAHVVAEGALGWRSARSLSRLMPQVDALVSYLSLYEGARGAVFQAAPSAEATASLHAFDTAILDALEALAARRGPGGPRENVGTGRGKSAPTAFQPHGLDEMAPSAAMLMYQAAFFASRLKETSDQLGSALTRLD